MRSPDAAGERESHSRAEAYPRAGANDTTKIAAWIRERNVHANGEAGRVSRVVVRGARRVRRHHGDAQDRLGQQLLEGARLPSTDDAARLGKREAGDGARRA